MAEHPFFDGVEASERATAAGPCEVPVRLFDAAVLGLVYRVEPERVEAVMGEHASVEPLVTMGKAMVQLLVVEAREASVGPFAQVAVGVQVRRRGTSPSRFRALFDPQGDVDQGYLPLAIAVSTAAMAAACEAFWSLSAHVADVETDFRPTGVRAEVPDELELLIGEPGTMKTPGPAIALLSRDPPVVRTLIDVDHRLVWGGGASASLRVLGDGPIGEAAIRLGLEEDKPRYVWRSLDSRAVLPLGEPLAAAGG